MKLNEQEEQKEEENLPSLSEVVKCQQRSVAAWMDDVRKLNEERTQKDK